MHDTDKQTPPAAVISDDLTLGEKLAQVAQRLPAGSVSVSEILLLMQEEGLLLCCAFMVLPMLVPISIPGLSTVFGAAILLIGISLVTARPLWLPQRFRSRRFATDKLRAALEAGAVWVHRLERVIRPHRAREFAHGAGVHLLNSGMLGYDALLLMAPLIPFSNTLPGLAVLLLVVGMLEKDGVSVLLGHFMAAVTTVYFALLFVGGGALVHQAVDRLQ